MKAADAVQWFDAIGIEDVPEGEVRGIKVADELIALYCVNGRIHATSDVCTHEYGRLSEGWLENGEIECPLHGARFRVEDGQCLGPYGTHLRCFRTRTRQGRIEIEIASSSGNQA